MRKEEIKSKIEEFLNQESLKGTGPEFSDLIKEFYGLLGEEEKKQQQKELAEDQGEESVELTEEEKLAFQVNEGKNEEIKELIAVFKARRSEERKKQEEAQKNNAIAKNNLINELEKLNVEEERIGPSINQFKAIQIKWKSIGGVSSDKYNDLQARYSKAVDQFNYNIGIYKVLKSHDLKKNQELKEEMILEVKALLSQDKIRDIERSLKEIQQRWTETGGTEQEAWERLKTEYWENVKAVQKKIQDFYDQRKVEFKENLALKITLIEKVQASLETFPTNHKEWESKTKELLSIQEEWNKVGFAERTANEQAKGLFRSFYDTFFDKKQVFYSALKEEGNKHKEAKEKLIAQAKELETSTDWKNSTEKLIRLQKQWKNIGSAGKGTEQKLWTIFRSSCDSFFEAKNKHYEELDKVNEGNLILKKELISKISEFSLSENNEENMLSLRSFTKEFDAVGNVPFKEKDNVYNAFKAAIEVHYDGLNMEASEKEALLFESRIETLKQSADPEKAFDQEKINIRNQIAEINKEIIQFENNLGFFSGKGAEKLKEQVDQNIAKSKKDIQSLKERLKLIPQIA